MVLEPTGIPIGSKSKGKYLRGREISIRQETVINLSVYSWAQMVVNIKNNMEVNIKKN